MPFDATRELARDRASHGVPYLVLRLLVAWAWWTALLIVPIVALVVLLRDAPVPLEVRVDFAEEPLAVGTLREGALVVLDRGMRGELFVDARALGVLAWLGWLVSYGLLLLVLAQVRGLVGSLRRDAFVAENSRRLTRIGWGLLALAAARFLVAELQGRRLEDLAAVQGGAVRAVADLGVGDVALPLLLLVVAQVFRIGSSLERERRLVV